MQVVLITVIKIMKQYRNPDKMREKNVLQYKKHQVFSSQFLQDVKKAALKLQKHIHQSKNTNNKNYHLFK